MSTILLIEDERALRRATARRLERSHVVHVAGDAAEACTTYEAHRTEIEVVVTDIDLPDGDGIDLVRRFRQSDPTVGAVVATGVDDPGVAGRVVASQVQGYLLKPFEHTELEVNVANALRWRQLEQENRRHREHLTDLVRLRTEEVRASRWETIRRLAIAAEYRDPETADHIERMSAYSGILAQRAGLPDDRCEEIRLASPMHDIGKLGIPDDVLTHTGLFDPAQRSVMNQHTLFGWEILSGSDSSLLQTAAVIARSHHEWWDGTGYPFGLGGEQIPLEGRIVAIADVFDALTSPRRYKPAISVGEAIGMMVAERGTHFDPELLDLFVEDLDDLLAVRHAFADPAVGA
jgi:putative two-component system response regulator